MKENSDVQHKFKSAADFYQALLDVEAVYDEIRKKACSGNLSFSQAVAHYNFSDGTTLASLFAHMDALKLSADGIPTL